MYRKLPVTYSVLSVIPVSSLTFSTVKEGFFFKFCSLAVTEKLKVSNRKRFKFLQNRFSIRTLNPQLLVGPKTPHFGLIYLKTNSYIDKIPHAVLNCCMLRMQVPQKTRKMKKHFLKVTKSTHISCINFIIFKGKSS